MMKLVDKIISIIFLLDSSSQEIHVELVLVSLPSTFDYDILFYAIDQNKMYDAWWCMELKFSDFTFYAMLMM